MPRTSLRGAPSCPFLSSFCQITNCLQVDCLQSNICRVAHPPCILPGSNSGMVTHRCSVHNSIPVNVASLVSGPPRPHPYWNDLKRFEPDLEHIISGSTILFFTVAHCRYCPSSKLLKTEKTKILFCKQVSILCMFAASEY
jgi:hypothetical protein